MNLNVTKVTVLMAVTIEMVGASVISKDSHGLRRTRNQISWMGKSTEEREAKGTEVSLRNCHTKAVHWYRSGA